MSSRFLAVDNVSGRVSNHKALFRMGMAIFLTAAFDGDANEIRPGQELHDRLDGLKAFDGGVGFVGLQIVQ